MAAIARRRLRWITAALLLSLSLSLGLAAPSFADEPKPRASSQKRKLKGRDVAMLLWLPLAVFSVGSVDGGEAKPAKKRPAPAKREAAPTRP
jgi:hypothetical protein